MTKIQNPKQLLKQFGIKPSKRLGQNFLIDKSILKKIIEASELSPKDIVLEIGPGLGILTLELAKQVKKVIAVEKDRKMCEILKNVLFVEDVINVVVVQGDILQFQQLKQLQQLKQYKLVANLPYYITSPVIRKFLEAENRPELMVLMIQKEVAQRICAKPPHMNLLAVAVQFYASSPHQKFGVGTSPKIISYVSKKSFWPIPKVDSAIIKIIPRKSALLSALFRDKFFELVKAGFSSKRKMLKNNIPGIDFEKIGLNPKIRAENLLIEEWLRVFHNLYFS
ncbi:MAG: 16S rRNA (adenine(1518)-N(6)/adenine(1519)-N(6))-dimethyltransferase RsmA [Patescibacteria group bacterium]